jgi:hypothetical protein
VKKSVNPVPRPPSPALDFVAKVLRPRLGAGLFARLRSPGLGCAILFSTTGKDSRRKQDKEEAHAG